MESIKTISRIGLKHIFVYSILFTCLGKSQADPDENVQHYQYSANVAKARIDLAVPAAPAMQILNTGSDMLMRPGNVREVGIAISDLLQAGGSIELSPALLLGDVTLSEYQANPFLYRFRVSVATGSTSNGDRDYGWGFRFTILDETDLRIDKQLQDSLVKLGHEINSIYMECTRTIDSASAENPIRIQEHIDSCFTNLYDQRIADVREIAKVKNWNKPIFEVGIAGAASSSDSSLKHLIQNKYGLWMTGGFPLLNEKGQIVIGLKALVDRNASNKLADTEGSLAARGYIGGNKFKGFLETDWMMKKNLLPAFSINVGGELNVLNGVWIDCSIGISKQRNTEAALTNSFNIRIATPEMTSN
ncbi:MAG: hypothetical protein HY800_05710 [Ignavibacteriales bacterium]|nr:hypothetical protein [Ignavibacteriales bacterium]